MPPSLVLQLEEAHLSPNLEFQGEPLNFLADAGTMGHTTHDRFVNIDVAIPDFQIKATVRVSTNPGFVVNSCPLTAKIG